MSPFTTRQNTDESLFPSHSVSEMCTHPILATSESAYNKLKIPEKDLKRKNETGFFT